MTQHKNRKQAIRARMLADQVPYAEAATRIAAAKHHQHSAARKQRPAITRSNSASPMPAATAGAAAARWPGQCAEGLPVLHRRLR